MNWLVPINSNVNKRETGWICVCDVCQHERIITYAQSWNIKKGNSKRTCRNCQYDLRLIPIYLEGLKLGRKFHNAKRDKKNCGIANQLRALFTPETVTNREMRQKQSLAKLGKIGPEANRWIEDRESLKKKRREKRRQYVKNRLKNDPVFYAMKLVRNRVNSFIKNKNRNRFSKKLGCSYETFKNHIEKQFSQGMTWENYGKWHIDHKFPLSKAVDDIQLLKACHYTNLQPLWAMDNLKKGNRLWD